VPDTRKQRKGRRRPLTREERQREDLEKIKKKKKVMSLSLAGGRYPGGGGVSVCVCVRERETRWRVEISFVDQRGCLLCLFQSRAKEIQMKFLSKDALHPSMVGDSF
jgi:hypothetical protein